MASALPLAGAMILIYLFNPIEHGFFPKCLLHSTTGWDCPGCGGLRATHQLLHGNFTAAFKLNPLFVAMIPLAVFFALRETIFICTGRHLAHPFKSQRWIWLLAIVVVTFGVLRNLPWRSWLNT